MTFGNKIIVQKYGGATLADPEKIKAVATRLANLRKDGTRVVAVVSAMGKTTNQLIDLAHQISDHPNRREMDMLLTTGERVSMALVTMALHDLGIPAISFTGSQAGILTDDSHFNAQIQDVKAFRVTEAIEAGKIVVLAGFQGVSPVTKEITTLGRGGSDSTAVAMAAFLKAEHCEILKEVPAVFTADPQLVKDAKVLTQLDYDQMLDMTFWGAKVLHYRSVELARARKVRLYIGPAAQKTEEGTWVDEVSATIKPGKVLSINSHEKVLELFSKEKNQNRVIQTLNQFLESHEIAPPQLLHSTIEKSGLRLFITGPHEIISAAEKELAQSSDFKMTSNSLASVTLTGAGLKAPEQEKTALDLLQNSKIPFHLVLQNPLSSTIFLDRKDRERAIQLLHSLI